MSLRVANTLSILVAALAWVGLALYTNSRPPNSMQEISLALLLLTLAISATAMPLWAQIQKRIARRQVSAGVAARQGMLTGVAVATLILFRLAGFRDIILLVVIVALFIMLEAFWQQRDQKVEAKQKRQSKRKQGA